MVTQVYYCDICHSRYKTEEEASECESKGKMKQKFPVGTIIKQYHKDMVFVIAGFHQDDHHAHYSAWGFRDTDAGDNAPKLKKDIKKPSGTCGFDHWDGQSGIYGASEPDRNMPCYKRAVRTMKKLGVKPVAYKCDAISEKKK